MTDCSAQGGQKQINKGVEALVTIPMLLWGFLLVVETVSDMEPELGMHLLRKYTEQISNSPGLLAGLKSRAASNVVQEYGAFIMKTTRIPV